MYWKKLGKDKNHNYYINYAKYRNLFNNLKKIAKQSHYSQLLTTYRNDIRKTWGVINALIGRSNDKSSISETLKINIKTSLKVFVIFFYKYWYCKQNTIRKIQI